MIDLSKYKNAIHNLKPVSYLGKISQIIGLTIESVGPQVSMGEICKIKGNDGQEINADVVGFKNSKVLLMPLGDMNGVGFDDFKAVDRLFRVGVDRCELERGLAYLNCGKGGLVGNGYRGMRRL